MNIRARVRAQLSRCVSRVRPHPRSRLSFGRSRGQRRAPLSTASTAVRFAANASRCVSSHYAYADTCVHGVYLCACDRSGVETPPLGDVPLVQGSPHTSEFGYTRDDFFPVVLSRRYLNDRSGRRGDERKSASVSSIENCRLIRLYQVPMRICHRERKCARRYTGAERELLHFASLPFSLTISPRLKFVSPKVQNNYYERI